ncbi:Hypothetical protein, predicted lipoprotein, DUF285 family [Mycoplasmopsis agalactiae 14628]|uniref:Lipoprotein n=1 Tax=Mycoplasmopsis agalactiae 14628 TaxID=1110504 RepID=I5D672_MYCAA|nr:BspA family leucine-rich repeat surface protein [Mycoplasmopsis agalactiae]EIN15181.1 Hypothetical protein, predicted lipoprotein, DUF285 family [Mycoplasmopsis agalactiae 14628]
MKKKLRNFISISSLSSLLLMPLVAASCKKNDNGNNNKAISEGSNPEHMTPPNLSNDENKNGAESGNVEGNMPNANSSEKSDTMNKELKPEEKDISNELNNNSEMLNDQAIENNESSTTYSDASIKRKAEEEAKKKQEEEKKLKEAKDKDSIAKIKEIIEKHKDAFGAFHTQGDFLDQINVYASDEGIEGLKLQNESSRVTKLVVDEDGKGKKNKISLKLGSQDFQVELGRVLEKAVVTKYYLKSKPDEIKDNYLKSGENKIDANWGVTMKAHEVVITQLGYHNDYTGIKLTPVGKKTVEVPKRLPIKISSINLSFYNLESSKINNIDEWDLSNVKNAGQAFYNAKNFSQDLSKWKVMSGVNTQQMFQNASKMKEHLDKIAKAWKVKAEKLK